MRIEKVMDKDKVLAMFLFHGPYKEGIEFFTPDENALQVGRHSYQKGKTIKPHRHHPVKTERFETMQEVLLITKGVLKIFLYTDEGRKIDEKTLQPGDMAVLIGGGHGFEMLEDTQFIEIKQGPYNPESKKPLQIQE